MGQKNLTEHETQGPYRGHKMSTELSIPLLKQSKETALQIISWTFGNIFGDCTDKNKLTSSWSVLMQLFYSCLPT